MPELPEVETIRRELVRKILNKKIIDVKIIKSYLIKEPTPKKFRKELIGSTLKDIIRKGKALIIKLKEDKYLLIHLRIAGWLLYGKKDKGARVVFKFSNGKFLNYMDKRLLGEIRLTSDWQKLKFIKRLGPEPNEISLEEFKDIFKNKKSKVKALLMDQSKLAGLGNIYAQESLFWARISPLRQGATLTDKEIKALYQSIKGVLAEALRYRGSSVDSYRDTEGNAGGMEERLKVYQRKGKPCFRCNAPIKKISLAGRGTCYCPRCQK